MRISEGTDEPINGFWPDLIEETIEANLEPLNEQTSTLAQQLNQPIQEKSSCISSTASPRTQQTQLKHSPSNEAGTSRVPQTSANGSMGYPADNGVI